MPLLSSRFSQLHSFYSPSWSRHYGCTRMVCVLLSNFEFVVHLLAWSKRPYIWHNACASPFVNHLTLIAMTCIWVVCTLLLVPVMVSRAGPASDAPPAYTLLCHCDALHLCWLLSYLLPFKWLAVHQQGWSLQPHQRLQGLLHSRPWLHRYPCWCSCRQHHGWGWGCCRSCTWRTSPTSR